MREIRFRGKRIGTSEWVYGDLIHRQIWSEAFPVIRMQDDGFDIYEECEVISETVGQYTGLKDKNGKEIFEGDIVFAIATYDCANTVVVWDDGGFVLVPCKYYKNYISRCGYKDIRFLDKEVVGNIHDNPELLEEE